jgi:hypothetical protein
MPKSNQSRPADLRGGDTVLRDARELEPEQWAKALLEEILLQAALAAPASAAASDVIALSLTFFLRADKDRRAVEIATSGVIERELITRIPID